MGSAIKKVKKQWSRSVGAITDVAEDVSGVTAAREADKARVKQEALIAEQEVELEKKRKIAQDVTDERRVRLSQNQLLSGSQTGTTGAASTNTLLGVS